MDTRGEVFLRISRTSVYVENVREEYHGRGYYEGPAATVPTNKLGDFLAEMPLPCKWDNMGKSSMIVYPRSPGSDPQRELERARSAVVQVTT